MQVTELPSEGLKKQYKVIIPAQRINEATEKELRAAGEKIKMPGFRPGFIPLKVLQQRYGKSVQGDVLKQVINSSSNELISGKSLRPIATPQITIDDYQDGGDLHFTMSFDNFPAIKDIDYGSIKLERKTFEIAESDLDKAVADLMERTPKLAAQADSYKAAKGDVVDIDFKGSIDNVPFEGGAGEGYRLELGSGQFIEGFEDQLIGAKKGEERTVNVTFPKEYPGAEVAGKEASFAVTVNSVLKKEAGELTDEFAKEHGFADARAVREAIRTQMLREYEQVVRNQLKKQLFDGLDSQFDFELPESMVELEFKTIWERLKQARAQGDDSVAGKSEEELEKEYQQIARRRVKLGLLLAEIGNKQGIQVTRDELGRAVMQQASMFPGQEKNVLSYYRDHPERMEELRGPILEEKAVDFILSKVSFEERKVSLDELSDDEEEMNPAPAKKSKAKAKEKAEESGEESAKKPAAKKKAAGNKE